MQGYGFPAPAQQGSGDVGSLSEAREAVELALRGYGNPDLEVAEVMEFANNYYAEVVEKDTGVGAMELLVDRNLAIKSGLCRFPGEQALPLGFIIKPGKEERRRENRLCDPRTAPGRPEARGPEHRGGTRVHPGGFRGE